MSKRKTFGVFSVVVAMVFTACGPPVGDGDGGDGGGSARAEGFERNLINTVADGICGTVYDCPQPLTNALESRLGRFPNKAECVKSVTPLFQGAFEQQVAAVAEGRMAYDAEAASACLAEIRVADACTFALFGEARAPSCELVFVGLVEDGGFCTTNDECAGDARCVEEGDACFGTCVSNLGCGDVTCTQDEYCADAPDSFEVQCYPKLEEGDACEARSDCTLESENVECLTDAFGDDGVCTAYGTLGVGDYCDYESDFCGAGLECDTDTVECVAIEREVGSFLRAGEECSYESLPCEVGTACVDLDLAAGGIGRCGAVKGRGGECLSPLECGAGLTCRGANLGDDVPTKGTCDAMSDVGGPCTQRSDCFSNDCDSGVCVGRPEVCEVP